VKLTREGLGIRDENDVERVAIKPVATGSARRLSESSDLSSFPVLQIKDGQGRNKTDIGDDGNIVLRDDSGVERVKHGYDGLVMKDEAGAERASLKNEGNETLSTKDESGNERFRISRFGDLQTIDDTGSPRFAVDMRGSLELLDSEGKVNFLADEYGMGVQGSDGTDVMAFSRSSGTMDTKGPVQASQTTIDMDSGRPANHKRPSARVPGEMRARPPPPTPKPPAPPTSPLPSSSGSTPPPGSSGSTCQTSGALPGQCSNFGYPTSWCSTGRSHNTAIAACDALCPGHSCLTCNYLVNSGGGKHKCHCDRTNPCQTTCRADHPHWATRSSASCG